MENQIPLEKCDVADKANLRAFQELRTKWSAWFDIHNTWSVTNQILLMLWDDAVFRVAHEIRRQLDESPKDGFGINSEVLNLIDRGYVCTQSTCIRRLTETQRKNAKYEIISLRRIVDEMEENRSLITREHFVCYDGLPFEIKSPKESDIPVEFKLSIPHGAFDRLSKKKCHERTRGDLIQPEIFPKLRSRLDDCLNVCTYVDKFIAHTEDPKTMLALKPEERSIALERLTSCHKSLCQVAAFVYGEILHVSTALFRLPYPQYDHLENFDKPWIDSANVKGLYDYWHERGKAIEKWADIDWIYSEQPARSKH